MAFSIQAQLADEFLSETCFLQGNLFSHVLLSHEAFAGLRGRIIARSMLILNHVSCHLQVFNARKHDRSSVCLQVAEYDHSFNVFELVAATNDMPLSSLAFFYIKVSQKIAGFESAAL